MGETDLLRREVTCYGNWELCFFFRSTPALFCSLLFWWFCMHTGEAPTPSPKIISVSGAKNEPKRSLFSLLVFVMTTFPFLICWWKNPKPASEALRGLGRKTYWHEDKARLTGTRNYIILLLKSQQSWTWSSWQLCCLARILSRSWRKETASTQASRPQGYGNCSQTKSLEDEV